MDIEIENKEINLENSYSIILHLLIAKLFPIALPPIVNEEITAVTSSVIIS